MIKKKIFKNDFILLIVLSFLFLLFVSWLVYFVPPDSDEFLAYYNIACNKFEGSRLAYVSGYDISCESFKLKLFGQEYSMHLSCFHLLS